MEKLYNNFDAITFNLEKIIFLLLHQVVIIELQNIKDDIAYSGIFKLRFFMDTKRSKGQRLIGVRIH